MEFARAAQQARAFDNQEFDLTGRRIEEDFAHRAQLDALFADQAFALSIAAFHEPVRHCRLLTQAAAGVAGGRIVYWTKTYLGALWAASLALPIASLAAPAALSATPSARSLSLPTALPMVSFTDPTPFWVAPSIPSLLMG